MSSQSTAVTARARRLSAPERRDQLLDCARSIILERGLSSVTMELLASEAGVSNPLIYKYFDTRLTLLQALLERELEAFGDAVARELALADNFEDIVRVFVTTNFDQFEKGSIINVLLSQPDVRGAISDVEGKRAGSYLVRQLRKHYDVSSANAEALVVFGAGASQAAAARYANAENRDEMLEEAVRFVTTAIDRLAAR